MIWSILLSILVVVSGVLIIIFIAKKPRLFWPFLIVISVGTAGLMIRGYCLIDEFLLGCLLFGVVLSGSFKPFHFREKNRLSLFYKCLFFLLIIYLFFQSWRGFLLWQDAKTARWIIFYLLMALLALVLFKKPFSSFDSKKISLIALITALAYLGLYLFHGLFAEIVRGISRFSPQGIEWSGSAYAVFPLIIAFPAAILLFKERNFIFRILGIGFLALSTIITFYYDSRLALLIILVFLFFSFFVLGLRRSLILVFVFLLFTGFMFSFKEAGIVKHAENYYKTLKGYAAEFYKPGGHDVDRYICFRASIEAVNENWTTFLFGYGYYSHRRVLTPYLQKLNDQYLPGQIIEIKRPIRPTSFSAWLVDTGWIGIGLLLLNLLVLSVTIVIQKGNSDRFLLLLVGPFLIFWMLVSGGFDIVLFYLLIMPSGLLVQLSRYKVELMKNNE